MSSVERASLVAGTVLDDYRVVRAIGVGGMGCVYEAEHTGLGRRVALKTLNAEYAHDEEVRGRFLREGVAVARIRHPNIVGVAHVGTAQGVTYLVMDLLEGEDLAARLAREGALAPSYAVEVVLAVTSAIEAAHEAGVIHRDLKPANVFLERTRREVVPRVLDFGISKLTDRVGDTTRSVALLGSPHYMSPEQARSSKSVDWRTDQYALGVILYECLTGQRPFRGDTVFELVYAITSTNPTPPSSLVTLPDGLEAVVLRAMSRELSDRFPTLREFAMALIPFAPPDSQRRWQQEFAPPSALDPASAPGVDKHAFIDTLASANREVPSARPAPAAPRANASRFLAAAALGAALVTAGVWSLRQGDAPVRAAASPPPVSPPPAPAPARVDPPAPQAVGPTVTADAGVAVRPAVAPVAAAVANPPEAPRTTRTRGHRSRRMDPAAARPADSAGDEFRVR
ncbi:MAG: serine/threonine-protein kinase [Polyangiales bacterium]